MEHEYSDNCSCSNCSGVFYNALFSNMKEDKYELQEKRRSAWFCLRTQSTLRTGKKEAIGYKKQYPSYQYRVCIKDTNVVKFLI